MVLVAALGILLVFLFYLLNFFISMKNSFFFKNSPFECGFSSVGMVQNSFSVHFFIMMLIFIIFDLEIIMFLGVLVSDLNSFFSFVLVIFFIFFGFYMEWWYNKLYWSV